MKKDFNYKSKDGLVDINTLSPSGNYYYRVKPPVELNKSAYGCGISFWGVFDNRLIYLKNNSFAHEIYSKNEIDHLREKMNENDFDYSDAAKKSLRIINWSNLGNVAYFIEYQKISGKTLYNSVILNLEQEYFYSINENDNDFAIANSLNLTEEHFDGLLALEKLAELGFKKQPACKDQFSSGGLIDIILCRQKWHP